MIERRNKSASCSTRFLFLLLFVYSCLVNPSRGQIEGVDVRVANAENRFRSQVLIKLKYHWRTENGLDVSGNDDIVTSAQGSGTIIGSSWILTAASVFNKVTQNVNFEGGQVSAEGTVYYAKIMAGEHNQDVAGFDYPVSHVIIHRDYDKSDIKAGNDIALMQLEHPFNQRERHELVEKVELAPFQPKHTSIQTTEMECAMAGWGENSMAGWVLERSNVLLWAPLRIVGYKGDLIETKGVKTKGKRKYFSTWGGDGDSGSGLLCKKGDNKYLFGVLSHFSTGESQNGQQKPNIFTSVYHHKDWINKVMKRKESIAWRSESTMFVKSLSDGVDHGLYQFNVEQL